MNTPIPQSDLKRQYQSLKAQLHAALERVFDSGWFILGPEVEAFEREFAAYHGAAHAVGVGNGTDAIHLALRALDVGAGDEVLVPDNTAFPTATAVTAAGATPVFVDVEQGTATMDPSKLQERITPRTKAIVPVHLYGLPADMDAILQVAGRRGIPVVEDACQAHGTTYRGRKVGTLGAMGCFSFYPSKNLGAYGDGGLVTTNDADLDRRLRMLRNYGQCRRYYHEEPGFNSRLDELQAAFLRLKLTKLDGWIEARRSLASRYRQVLDGLPVGLPGETEYGRHTYHLFVIRSERRDELAAHLAAQGISTLIHYPVPLHLQGAFACLGGKPGQFPVSERLAGQILSLPLFPEMRDEEVNRVGESIREFFDGSRI